MDDKSPNFVLLDLGLDRPSLREFKALRRMPVFALGGTAIHGSVRKRHSAIEVLFIAHAFAATPAPPREQQPPPPPVLIRGDWLSRREIV